jgi:trans-aconitate methyltransferase
MRTQVLLTGALLGLLAMPAQTPPKMVRVPEVPYLATTEEVAAAMLRLAGVNAADTVYDLGCGDGRIVIMAAQRYQARGVGIDLNSDLVQRARTHAGKAGVEPQVRFEVNDLFDADIHDASVVTLYLLPQMNLRLRPKLLNELKPGSRIVSHNFDMGDWKPEKVEEVDGQKIFLWTIPPTH